MDRLALLLYVSRVEGKALGIAREARDLGSAIAEADFVDEAMLVRRAQMLDGLAEMRADDLRVLQHPTPLGRLCVRFALRLLRVARALR